jgi:UDP-2,3-diacylglucosamine hydrolase
MAFKWLHPDISVRLAQYLSVKTNSFQGMKMLLFLERDNEWLILYSKRKLETKHYNYLIFVTAILPMKVRLVKIQNTSI